MKYNGNRSALALTFDHEMSTNFPYRRSVWDQRKGDIDAETRAYVAEEFAIAAEYDVRFTYFLVASALENEDNVSQLRQASDAGHEIGNHTYTHVNVTADQTSELRGIYAFRPWLVGERDTRAVIRDEIAAADELIQQKLDVSSKGFRTPYGFPEGLRTQEWLTQYLLEHDFIYTSSYYFGWDLWDEELGDIGLGETRLLEDLRRAQPFCDEMGLWEIPFSTPTDCHVFRPWRWPVSRWVDTVMKLIDLCYEHELALVLCCHPSILAACDPEHRTTHTAISHAQSKTDGVWITTLSELVLWEQQAISAGRQEK